MVEEDEQPRLVARFGDEAYVFLKPPHWEVDAGEEPHLGKDSQDTEGSVPKARRISDFLRRGGLVGVSVGPIALDRSHSFGLLHRLDTNSSGLILGACSYAAYNRLHWALHTYQIEREYIVLCHGHVPPGGCPPSCLRAASCGGQRGIITVNARLVVRGGTSRVVGRAGLPAVTHLKVVAHLSRAPSAKHPEGQAFSLLVVSIHTGRHHQIRAHLHLLGHPTVSDARYGVGVAGVLAAERRWCPRNFLHRFRLGRVPLRRGGSSGTGSGEAIFGEASAALPADLAAALHSLQPLDAPSAAAVAAATATPSPPPFAAWPSLAAPSAAARAAEGGEHEEEGGHALATLLQRAEWRRQELH